MADGHDAVFRAENYGDAKGRKERSDFSIRQSKILRFHSIDKKLVLEPLPTGY
jgi:hypothetical protein